MSRDFLFGTHFYPKYWGPGEKMARIAITYTKTRKIFSTIIFYDKQKTYFIIIQSRVL